MPTTPRKSSLGGTSRRGPLKAHIPYRGDNPEVGKKTGIAVQHVARQSDGFEPFEQIMQQADGRTPPRPKGRRKSVTAAAHQDKDDYGSDDGWEESMQLDSPIQNMANTRPAVSPAKSHRSSIRPVTRTSDIDFDKIPSPRPNTSSQRSARNGVPRPSSASKYMRLSSQSEPNSGSPDPGDQDDGIGPDPFDDYAPQENRSSDEALPRKSFGGIDQEEDEDEDGQEEEEPPQETPSKRDKGKRKAALYEEPDQDDVEDEIAQELENVELELDSDVDQEVEEPPSAKKAKTESRDRKAQTKTRKAKENIAPRQGVRRSQREHYKPLEYWRGEKLVYGRTPHSGPILVPQIKEIVRIPKEVPVPLRAKRRRGVSRTRSFSKVLDAADDVIPPALPVVDPEEGWDDSTEAKCTVIHFTSMEEVERRIAWTAKMVNPRQAADNGWMFDKIFGDDDFIAAGQLIIPPKGRKPSKAAKDNTYVFYVIEGAVNLKIHDTSMILATGGMFMVPRGNTYFIENICERDAKLFFTQARKVPMSKEELDARGEVGAEPQRRKSSSSGGALSKLSTPNGQPTSSTYGN